jgi:hypothetical protein
MLVFMRHLSLPARDGRVPLVGLDRELSAQALFHYQARRAGGAGFEALPVRTRSRDSSVLDLEEGRELPELEVSG